MTREEAIQSLKDLAEINVRYGCDDKWIMALNIAIEALQREEAEANGYCHRIKPKEYFSADAVHGEWEHWGSPFSDESEVIDTIVCSVCGARFIEPKDEPKGEYNFCPNCGAKMDKGGDTE